MKIAVVYYSGTGNTLAMAEAVVSGAKASGAEAELVDIDAFDAASVGAYDALAFGCPAMGAEVLEEGSFEPKFAACEASLSGKKIALFGSYGWGDGEWMRNWADRCRADGAILVTDPVICAEAPDANALSACNALGTALTR